MTEYGRGQGSEPWHPEDPLFGDGGWEGQQAQVGRQSAHGGQPQHHSPEPQYGDWGQGQQQGGYDQQQYQYYEDQGHQSHQGYDQEQYAASYPQQQYHQGGPQQQYHQGGWDATGTHGHVPYAADPGDPYGQQPVAYGGEQPDLYGTPDAYPPPEPPGQRRPEPEPEADPETGWDPGPDQGEHAFFAEEGQDDEDDATPDKKRSRGTGGKGPKSKKGRNGIACLVVVLVFGGGLGGVGYFGYKFYQNRYGPAPDYAGSGTGETVTVQIPKGAGGWEIGQKLVDAGVVKSVGAFISAQGQVPDGKSIQADAYVLKKEMSAASAVRLMLDPKSHSNVVVKPGERNASVYQAIDKQLGVASGTTKGVAKKDYKTLGLPNWANDNSAIMDPLEGFLFPGNYPAVKGMKPATVLKQMVSEAKQKYTAYGFAAKAKGFNLTSPLQLVTVASLVQAEGKTHDDFRKMAEVVYNRLKPTNTETNQLLQFDSTFNYLKGTSNIHISASEINSNRDPYNTYTHKGLPPGPIGNPGDDAIKAALDPTDDGWLYFVATDGQNVTEFAKTNAEFERLRDKFNASSGR